MNPLNRRMFRQPGMSRQPAGILASSPQLANTVANRQPVRMANGGMNNSTFTAAVQRAVQAGDKYALQELAKPVNYGAAARTPDGQNALRLARQALAQSTRVSTDAAIDAPVSDAERMAANRANLGAIRGRVSQDALTDQAMAQINAANRPSKPPVTGPRPDVAQRAKNMASIASQDRTESTPLINNPPSDSAMDQIKRAFMYPGEVLGFGVPDDAPGKANPIGQGIRNFVFGTEEKQSPVQSALRSVDDAIVSGTSAAGDAIQDLEKGIISGFIPKPTDTALADAQAAAGAVREGFPGRTAGEQLAENTVTSGGSQSVLDGTDPEADASITNNDAIARKVGTVNPDASGDTSTETNTTTASEGLRKLNDNLANIKGDIFNAEDQKNLTDTEATDPDVVSSFTYETAAMIDPESVNLEDIDKAARETMGFDPKAAKGKREDAFWMGLMKAGLAMAAGESSNAMTNIAKGLSFGLESYGKDIGTLNEQERADKKEFRQLKTQMIKDERSYNLTVAGIKNTHEQNRVNSKNQFERDKKEFSLKEATARRADRDALSLAAYRSAQLENDLIYKIEMINQGNEKVQLSKDALRSKEFRQMFDAGVVDKNGKPTAFGLEKYETPQGVAQAMLDLSVNTSKTGQAYTPERFAQAGLGTEDKRQGVQEEMITRFPNKYTKNNLPTTSEMLAYLESEARGGSEEVNTPNSLIGKDGPYGDTTERNGKTYTWNRTTGKYDPS